MEAEPRRGGARRVTLLEGQRFCVTGLSLADPAAARGQPLVTVWAEVGHEALAIGMLWTEQPVSSVPPLELDDAEFVLRHDSAWSSVRLYGYYLDPPDPDGEGAATRRQFLVDIVAEELPDEEEEEEDPRQGKVGDGEAAGESSKIRWNSIALVAAPAGIAVLDGEFLGPPRFAAVKNTAGFMRIAAADLAETGSQEGREIVVLYRYTRFSRTWSGRRGVEACRRTKLHWLRFAVPPAGDMASSLAWAGSSLSPLIYPGLFRRELRDLWSSLAAAATTAIPPHAARLQVIVDAGILRREDHTAERMEHMRGALEAVMGEAWLEYYHVGMELRLPEPVRREYGGGGDGDDARPAKRRRVAAAEDAEEECSLCLDPLESGLAAWPGCRHEFHARLRDLMVERHKQAPLPHDRAL
ncbi:hypothetical protein C2845_PM14G03990 [Panicum miliaceum]|uniref:Uncharacterized protein n=1 Tax=Panicum miliaceum TaxID=4540 RepID=A0A3L6PR09_PANMI|nr:hypothetical protein C2845_PM14G03990 [Panicum miliaceum]